MTAKWPVDFVGPVVLDLETRDPYLTTLGTDAHCRQWDSYVFLGGLYVPSLDLEITEPWGSEVKDYIRALLNRGCEWVGANLKYDLGWLLSEGVMLPHMVGWHNRFRDILIYAPLLDETQSPKFYSLDGQAKHYGLPGKPLDVLLEDAGKRGIKTDEKRVRGELYRLSTEVVKDYLSYDLRTTWAIYQKQLPLLEKKGLNRPVAYSDKTIAGVVELEDRLLPILAMMEHNGIRVDVDEAERLYHKLCREIDDVRERLRQENGGQPVPLGSSNALIAFLQNRGHKLPETAKSSEEQRRYSTDQKTLLEISRKDPLIGELLKARKTEKIAKDFCKTAIMERSYKGRIYPGINQIVGRDEKDETQSKGVRFGRLSYSMGKGNGMHPQQTPKRDTVEWDEIGGLGLGTAMRCLFPAEDGCLYMSADFSGQEPRWITHWAEKWNMPGAKVSGDAFRANPDLDYHAMVAEIAGVARPYAKIINLGKGYEMGLAKLMNNLVLAGVDPSEALRIIEQYDERFPHIKASSREAKAFADAEGYVRTYAGRLCHFNLYEPVVPYGKPLPGPAMPYEEAYQRYVMNPIARYPIRRAFTYRAFNRIIQGSSADQTKLAMIELWYEHRILPSMQVHDELDDAAIDTLQRAIIYKSVMENVVTLTVPCVTEVKLGPTWGSGKLPEVV